MSYDTGLLLFSFSMALIVGKVVMSIVTCVAERRFQTWGEVLKDICFVIFMTAFGIGSVIVSTI